MDANDDDDARSVELETLEAIYPELRRLEPRGFTFELEIPVAPAAPVTVLFPAPVRAANPLGAPLTAADVVAGGAAPAAEDSLQVAHLPPLLCSIVLPDGYPAERAPEANISTTPQWLSSETVTRLEEDAVRLWEEMGRDLVAYTYIDHIQRAADDVFGAITPGGHLEIHADHKLAVLDYDIKAKKAAFNKETFDCGICLDPKKGSKCHKMLDCGHIFCVQCLQSFYEDAIQSGNLSTVRCLAPNCAKERADAAKATASPGKSARKPKTFVSPSELLQLGLSDELVRRFVNLKYKTELESDKNTVYCPRKWCSGAARSKRHKKPSDLEFNDASGSDSDSDSDSDAGLDEKRSANTNKKPVKKFNPAELLSICEDCDFAFCSRCFQSWHGEFYHCAPRGENGELTEDDKASLEYLKLHTSPCPTCNAPAQKTMGCNHMICSRCDSHFCYLCSAWLDADNPYQHYNQQPNGKFTSCYMRLWELEGGDGDDVGQGFGGGGGGDRAVRPVAAAFPAIDAHNEIDQPHGAFFNFDDRLHEDIGRGRDQDEPQQPAGGVLRENQQRVAVAREAPLVLRIMGDNQIQPQGPVREGAAAAVAAAVDQPRGHAARQRGGGAGVGRARQARGARGAAAPRGARGARGGAGGAAGAGPERGREEAGEVGLGRGGAGPERGRGGAGPARGGRRQRGRQNPAPHQRNRPGEQENEQEVWRDAGAAAAAAAEGLDAPMEAWIRRFVQMALVDAEDQMDDGESDEEFEFIMN